MPLKKGDIVSKDMLINRDNLIRCPHCPSFNFKIVKRPSILVCGKCGRIFKVEKKESPVEKKSTKKKSTKKKSTKKKSTKKKSPKEIAEDLKKKTEEEKKTEKKDDKDSE